MLAKGPKYVPRCQSHFASHLGLEEKVEREFQVMSSVIKNCLAAHCVSASDGRANLFLISLKNLLRQLHTAQLPTRLYRCARQEYILTKDIRRQLHASRNQIVLRRTDKSKVFHLGSEDDYQQKAILYMQKTRAYEEVKNGKCPLAKNFSAVKTLLDRLLKTKAIDRKQWSTMMPKRDKVELGHLYFLPKPHKVRSSSASRLRLVCASVSIRLVHHCDLSYHR